MHSAVTSFKLALEGGCLYHTCCWGPAPVSDFAICKAACRMPYVVPQQLHDSSLLLGTGEEREQDACRGEGEH